MAARAAAATGFATNAGIFPSLASYRGSIPSSSQRPATSYFFVNDIEMFRGHNGKRPREGIAL